MIDNDGDNGGQVTFMLVIYKDINYPVYLQMQMKTKLNEINDIGTLAVG